MQQTEARVERRTATDIVFERLYEEIVSLEMRPGTKLSEVDVARRFGVSRQPIRDAFSRLDNLNLLLIRPQKATEVRGFSIERIAHSRFVRLAVELEVITRACAVWDKPRAKALKVSLDLQRQLIESDQPDKFHAADFEFHSLICKLSGIESAAETIESCKKDVDRLCRLSFGRDCQITNVLEDHEKIAAALAKKCIASATDIVRAHCARLDDTVTYIHTTHAEYFE